MTEVHDVEETFRHVAASVAVPPLDEVAFRRDVRRARAARLAVRAVAACAVTAVALGGTVASTKLVGPGDHLDVDAPVAGSVQGVAAADRPPVYLSVGGRLTALDSTGEVHRLGALVEEVLGRTSDGVMVVDRESHLLRYRAVAGPAGWRFREVEPPTKDPVQGAVLSTSPGLVAWLTLDDELVTFDLEQERVVDRVPVGPETRVFDVGSGVLVSEGHSAVLRDGRTTIELPAGDGWFEGMSIAGDSVAVTAREADGAVATRLYRRVSDRLRELDVVAGSGALSPDGSAYLAAPDEERRTRPVLWSRAADLRSLTGLAGLVTGVTWLDDDTAAVTTAEPRTSRAGMAGNRVYTCEVESGRCDLALTSGHPVVTLRW